MIPEERLIFIYRKMDEIRKFELKTKELFENNKLRGSVHVYVGEEAVAATVCSLLRDEDYITSTHRGHGHCIAKGARLDRALAELMGKSTGYCGGRGGSMHIADVSKGNLGANAIVGGGIPIAVGAGLSACMKETDQVSISFFGDGASNEGTFHEALNLAAVWKLPVIFICENNGYGISVPLCESTSVKDISIRSAGYGIPGCSVDGNDVFQIYDAVEKAIERAKKGEGPSLIECRTYRWLGHWLGDPQVYRTREEVEEWKRKDPIKKLRDYIIEKKIRSSEEIDKIEKEVDMEIEDAEKFALASPEPDPSGVLDNVFSEE